MKHRKHAITHFALFTFEHCHETRIRQSCTLTLILNHIRSQLFPYRIKKDWIKAFSYCSGPGSTSDMCHGWRTGAKIRLEVVLIITRQGQYLKSLLVVECIWPALSCSYYAVTWCKSNKNDSNIEKEKSWLYLGNFFVDGLEHLYILDCNYNSFKFV